MHGHYLYARLWRRALILGVYVNVVSCPRSLDAGEGTSSHTCVQDNPGSMVADDAVPGGVEAEEVVPTEGEVDAGCMDDEAGGSGDEDMTDEDDPQPTIQFFRAAGLLDCSVGDYRGLSRWGYQNAGSSAIIHTGIISHFK